MLNSAGAFPGAPVTSVLWSSSLCFLQIHSGPCIYWLFSFQIRLIIASRFLINYVYITFFIECFQSLSSDGSVDHYHWSVLDSWLMFTDSHICLSLAHDTPHFKKHSEVQWDILMLWKETENVWLAKKDQYKLHTTDYWICNLLSKFWCAKIKPYYLYMVTCFYLLSVSAPHLESFHLLLLQSSHWSFSVLLCWWNVPPKTTWVNPHR